MARVLYCVRSLSRSMTKVDCCSRISNRLCLGTHASFRIASRARSCYTSRHSSSTAVLPAFSDDEPECPKNNELTDHMPCDPIKLTGMKSTWMDREALHSVLEDSPLLQNNVFTLADIENTFVSHHKFPLLYPSEASISQASAVDIITFVVSFSNTMGRQDFQEICKHIAVRLHTFSEKEVLEFMKALRPLKFEANVTIVWDTIDEDLVRRFSSQECYQPTTDPDFFLQAVDITYWLNIISRSRFVNNYLTTMMKRELLYPISIQLLFYASCGPLKWRANFQMTMLYPFLNQVKRKCPFDLFLVALECSLACNTNVNMTFKSQLPYGLYHFLIDKASENISNDKALTIIFQLLFTHSKGSNNPSPFQKLIRKILERRQSVSSVVIYYVCYIMARFGTEPEQFINLLESSLKTKYLHPQVFWRLVMSVYAHFGPEVVNKLSDVIGEELQRQDLCTLPEGQLLRIFNVLVDCGINAFHLWETTMQGDSLVSNFSERSSFQPKNGLHLSADDCIEIHCPTYSGSRLSETLRKQLYYEFCDVYKNSNPCPGLLPLLQSISNGNILTTNVVPGFMTPGVKDVILCKNNKGQFCDPTYFINCEKPWSLKKIFPCSPGLSFFAVWYRPQGWPLSHSTLKQRALEKLGYTSVMVDTQLWDFPETCRDQWLYSKLSCNESRNFF